MVKIIKFQEKNKNIILKIIGILFLLWGTIAILNGIFTRGYSHVLWYCYIGLILIGIGIITKKSTIIGAQINILLIPILVWNADFLYLLITNKELFGITNYIFYANTFSNFISLQHLFVIPLSLYCLWLIKTKKINFWKISIIQITLLFLITLMFTSVEENINCIHETCLNFEIGFLPYKLTWFLGFFALILISNFILSKLSFLKDKARFNKHNRLESHGNRK